MLNEGAIKFNQEYISKVDHIISEHIDDSLIYYCINNYPKENLSAWIDNFYENGTKKFNMLSDSIKIKILHEIFNVYWTKFMQHLKLDVGIKKYVSWNNNNMFDVKFDVKKLTYEYMWKQNYDKVYQLHINIDTDVPPSYKKYINKFINTNFIKMEYIFTDNSNKYGITMNKDQIGMCISDANDFSNSYIIINMELAFKLGNAKRIKYILLLTIKHELTHALQMGKFGKMNNYEPYYLADFIEKYGSNNHSDVSDVILKYKKINPKELEIIYPISVKEYKAMLYTYAMYFFTKYGDGDISRDSIRNFIKDNPMFFKNILNKYGLKSYKKAIGDFYKTLYDENESKNKK